MGLDKIIITDLQACGIIGIDDGERMESMDILISLILYLYLGEAGSSDDLNKSINYAEVADKVKQLAETAQYRTGEGLAHAIADLCLKSLARKK